MIEAPVPTQAAGLFQKAHGKIVMLQRLDAQLAELLTQRKNVQAELNAMQSQINNEFFRLVNDSQELPGRILNETAPAGLDEQDDSDRVQLVDSNN